MTQAQQESVEPARPAGEDWVTRLADEVVEEATRRQGGELTRPIVCASGLSPSGPIHLGNLREVMVPHFVADEIARRGDLIGPVLRPALREGKVLYERN